MLHCRSWEVFGVYIYDEDYVSQNNLSIIKTKYKRASRYKNKVRKSNILRRVLHKEPSDKPSILPL